MAARTLAVLVASLQAVWAGATLATCQREFLYTIPLAACEQMRSDLAALLLETNAYLLPDSGW